MVIANIKWETDGQDIDLPEQIDLDYAINEDEIADYLSDKYGWLVNSFIITFH